MNNSLIKVVRAFLIYVVYIICLGFITIKGIKYVKMFSCQFLFNGHVFLYAMITATLPIIIGAPSFFGAAIVPGLAWTSKILLPYLAYIEDPVVFTISGIIFGYTLLDSFGKRN